MSETNKPAGCGGGKSGGPSAVDKINQMMMDGTLEKIRHKLVVMSGKGGVGKSSMSAQIALTLAERGLRVGLLDVDLHGPSIAGILGLEGMLDITQDKQAIPKKAAENLFVVSMQSLMPERDKAVIWRGPAKTGVIRQFIMDVKWGDLDFLVIDAPPGTGDEPLSVAQMVTGAKAVIITTPQEVALSDVRKSINFCRTVSLPILGLVENMGPFACPCCGKTVELFKSGGGKRTAEEMGLPFLGTVPFEPTLVSACDRGNPREAAGSNGFNDAMNAVVDAALKGLGETA